jgi:hypothetical protein
MGIKITAQVFFAHIEIKAIEPNFSFVESFSNALAQLK